MGHFKTSNSMRLLSGLVVALTSATSVQHVLATTTEQDDTKSPPCQWGPLVLQNPICTPRPPSTSSQSPFSKSREEWRALGWDGPNDCLPDQPDYCIYARIPEKSLGSSSSFSKDAGSPFIVISTAESMSAIASTIPPSISGKQKQQPISNEDYYTAEIPGKGNGLIARRKIQKGEIIMAQTPTLLVQVDEAEAEQEGDGKNKSEVKISLADRKKLYKKALEWLDEESRQKFLGQLGGDVVEIIDKNSFAVFVNDGDRNGGDEEKHFGLWPDVSLFNHDCRPNTHYYIKNLTHVTVAVRDIQPGEELTVSYIQGTLPYAERQERLKPWGFKCACHACSQDLSQISQSDARIKAISDLEDRLEEIIKSGEDIPADIGDRLVNLYLEERLDNYVAHVYTKAAMLKSMIGDKEGAVRYATLAVEALEREYGPGSQDGEAMRLLAERTEEHWSWGIRMGGWAM